MVRNQPVASRNYRVALELCTHTNTNTNSRRAHKHSANVEHGQVCVHNDFVKEQGHTGRNNVSFSVLFHLMILLKCLSANKLLSSLSWRFE